MPATPDHEQSIVAESVQTAGMRAMGLLASGRTWLVLLISLAVLFQIGLFVAANWGDVLRVRGAAPVDADVLAPQDGEEIDAPASAPVVPTDNFLQKFWPAETWRRIMETGLPIAGIVAVACAIILVPLTMIGVQVNLVSRLPGLPAAISAFYWSLITLVLMLPWGRLLGGVFAEKIPWVFCSYKDIEAAATALSDPAVPPGQVWLRFLVWPAIVLLAAWICGGRFGNAYWQVVGLAEMQAKARAEQPR